MCLPVAKHVFAVEKEWEHAGLLCAVVQAHEAGHRCGYVRVPPQHPAHGKDYESVDVSVHGGLTFAAIEPCAHDDGVGWWLGFDCAHCDDDFYDPSMKLEDCKKEDTRRILSIHREFHVVHDHFWLLPEVVTETEQLAEQLAKMGT